MRLVERVSILLVVLLCQYYCQEFSSEFDEEDGENGPSIDFKTRMAIWGLEIKPVGFNYAFDDVWHQFVVITKPKFSEYAPAINKLSVNCQKVQSSLKLPDPAMNASAFTVQAINQTINAMETYSRLFMSRCKTFEETLRLRTEQEIKNAFSEILPQPWTELESLVRLTAKVRDEPKPLPQPTPFQMRDVFVEKVLADGTKVWLDKYGRSMEALDIVPVAKKEHDPSNNEVLTQREEMNTEQTTPATTSTTSAAPSTRTTSRKPKFDNSTILFQEQGFQLPHSGTNDILNRKKRQFDPVAITLAASALAV